MFKWPIYLIYFAVLDDRISGKILGGGTNSRYLTDDEEQELVSFIIGCATIGYAKTVKEILAVVQRILAARGTYRPISYGWWEAFKKRHPNLSLIGSLLPYQSQGQWPQTGLY